MTTASMFTRSTRRRGWPRFTELTTRSGPEITSGIIGVAGFPASVPEPATFILGISAIVLTGMVTAVRRASH